MIVFIVSLSKISYKTFSLVIIVDIKVVRVEATTEVRRETNVRTNCKTSVYSTTRSTLVKTLPDTLYYLYGPVSGTTFPIQTSVNNKYKIIKYHVRFIRTDIDMCPFDPALHNTKGLNLYNNDENTDCHFCSRSV